MDYHLILNPAAGRGLVKKLRPRLLSAAESLPGTVQAHLTAAPGHAQQIAGELKRENAIVIAVGGDGTIHEIANGLVGGNCTLGIVPVGSGNDFVKMLNLPRSYAAALEVIRRGKTLTMDLGKVNDRYFINGLGLGFDAEVVIELQKVKGLRGFALYLYAVFKTLRRLRKRAVSMELNGRRENREVFMINVGNGEYLGGGFRLTPGAKIDDGALDVCIFRALSLGEVLRHLPKALSGKHVELPQVEFLRASELVVESSEGFPVHADGELLGGGVTRLEISLLPQALKVIHNLP